MAAERPTILQIIPELDAGGAELSTIEIASAIVAAGGRAIVLSEGGRLAPRLTAAGAEFIPFPAASKNPAVILANAVRIGRLIHDEKVDLVHARSRAPAWSALRASRRTGVPFVTTYHGAYSENGRLKKLYNSVMARGDIVIANSAFTANLIAERYATPRDRIEIIHRGVDGAVFDPAAIAPERLAKVARTWNTRPGDRIVLQAARLTAWKGQTSLIDAAALLRQRGYLEDVKVVLAGDPQGRDGYAEHLRQRIAKHGLGGQVIIAGHVDDMPAAYALARVAVVASSEPEAFGRTATEAQVMGCPVIATRIGAPPETVLAAPMVAADQATGWLVPPSDPSDLADALGQALALTSPQRAAMCARARRHVMENFTLDTMRARTLAVYDRLLGTGLAAAFEATKAN